MPNPLTLAVQSGALPIGACYATEQERVNGFSAVQTVIFPDTFDGITVSASKPSDTSRAWLQLDTLGRPTRLYFFAQGAWLSLHPFVPGSTMIWTTALPTLTSFDGGDANPVSSLSGPMWEVVLQQTFPLGYGTLPTSGTVVNIGDTGGEETHKLSAQETFPIIIPSAALPTGRFAGQVDILTPTLGKAGDDIVPGSATNAVIQGYGDPSSGTPPTTATGHNNMPVWTGVAFLRRTNRLYYVVP